MVLPDFEGTLHVTNNGSAAGLLRQALHVGRRDVLESEDPLDCGPIPVTDTLDDWRAIRENFLRTMYVYWPEFAFSDYADTGIYTNVDRLIKANNVAIWAGLGLPEQLLIAWVIKLFDVLGADVSKIRVMQFEHVRDNRDVRGIGELHPETIKEFCPIPHFLNQVELDELRRIWRVYTSSDPVQLNAYAVGISPLKIAHQAVRRLIYRYPDMRSGLSIWDEDLLRYTAQEGPKALRVIGHTMAYGWALDHPGDFYLFQRLRRLGAMKSPLLSISGDTSSMQDCEVRLTRLGENVLAGEINNFEQNGIDDWIGGVHLASQSPVTFRNGDSLMLI